MKTIIILAALLFASTLVHADEDATTTVVTTPPNGAAPGPDVTFGTLKIATTSRNGTGQIVWTCTYKLAASSKTVTFRNGCPDRLKFEMKHR